MFQLALSTAGILARLSPVPTVSPRKQGEGEQEGGRGQSGTPHPTHSPSTGRNWGCLAKAAAALGLAGGTWWVTPFVSLRLFLHLFKCSPEIPCFCSPCSLHQPRSIHITRLHCSGAKATGHLAQMFLHSTSFLPQKWLSQLIE